MFQFSVKLEDFPSSAIGNWTLRLSPKTASSLIIADSSKLRWKPSFYIRNNYTLSPSLLKATEFASREAPHYMSIDLSQNAKQTANIGDSIALKQISFVNCFRPDVVLMSIDVSNRALIDNSYLTLPSILFPPPDTFAVSLEAEDKGGKISLVIKVCR